jgi:hypothetical protein
MANLAYSGFEFEQRDNDGMVYLTGMVRPFGKTIRHWLTLASTTEFLNKLSSSLKEPVDNLVIVGKPCARGKTSKGTWGHPVVAIELARWISLDFWIWCKANIVQQTDAALPTHQPINSIQELPIQILPPSRDVFECIEAAKKIESLQNYTLKDLLTQRMIQELSVMQ